MTIPALFEYSRNLLTQDHWGQSELTQILAPMGFTDAPQAYRVLRRIADTSADLHNLLTEILPHLLLTISEAAFPDFVLVSFERFVLKASNPAATLGYLVRNRRTIQVLVTLFSNSQFLTEILLSQPAQFEWVIRPENLSHARPVQQLNAELQAELRPLLAQDALPVAAVLDGLRRFQRWEMVRIGTADLLDYIDLPTVTRQLANLADVLVDACVTVAARRTDTDPAGFAVLGMGKLGGEELNYSSDIDLIFLSAGSGQPYQRMGQQVINCLTQATGEGFLYRTDMRLRPWGRSGSLVTSVKGYLDYLTKHASAWEKQALLKARVIAGDTAVGETFLEQARPMLFAATPEEARAEVHGMKARIEAKLRKSGRYWGEVKLGTGSIRDIEFVTQYLQLAHGRNRPDIGSRNTLEALGQLLRAGFLSPTEYRVLNDGYIFLRTVEHHLQLMHYRQTHTLPNDKVALMQLGRRLKFTGPKAGQDFVDRYQQQSAAIRTVYQHFLEQTPVAPIPTPQPDMLPHLTRMPPAYVSAFSDAAIEQHAGMVDTLSETQPIKVAAESLDDKRWQVVIVGTDRVGVLSLICGLLFVHGFNIIDGLVFSYRRSEPIPAQANPRQQRRRRTTSKIGVEAAEPQKFVDVFTVQHTAGTNGAWQAYADDLTEAIQRLQTDGIREAQGHLVKRAASMLRHLDEQGGIKLYPVEIDIDNDVSDRHTVLRIDALDTVGFLYQLTNALGLNQVNIRRMTVETAGHHVRDVLYVTDAMGHKITDPAKIRELRLTTVLIKHFTELLPHAPNPEQALLHFHAFVNQFFSQPNWADELSSLEQPEVLNRLARLLGFSDFLWNDFLRMQHANLFPIVRDAETLRQRKSKAELREELEIMLQASQRGPAEQTVLNTFKDREMFRIDMRQIEGYITELAQFSEELGDLAEVVIESATHLSAGDIRQRYGLPKLKNGRPSALSVCALGKCGGREMGFASDIELMFIYEGQGRTVGARRPINTSEYFEKLVHEFQRVIKTRREGIFEVDLRLRPYGKAGSVAVSLDSFKRYFAPDGDAWPYERQALIRLRPIAGDTKLGQQIVRWRDQFVYTGEPFDVAAMRAMRERQVRHLVTAGTINAKFSPGALVDIEYLVQALQISFGHRHTTVRSPNTHTAMQALVAVGLMQQNEYQQLYEAYNFLLQLINSLRMVRGNAKDLTVPPLESEEFAFLAQRLGYKQDREHLLSDLTRHTSQVEALNTALLDELIG